MQNHYNLLYREDERELIPVSNQYGVSRIPYSPLAGGHLSHTGWTSGSKRSETDKSIRQKYDASKAVDLKLSDEDIAFLEEPYRAHEIVGALDKSLSLENVMPKKYKEN